MAVTRGTPATTSTPAQNTDSVFGPGKQNSDSTATAGSKRKMTDPNLEIITIDPMYDLTLIVGSQQHPKGQKAFRVSKGSFRNVSAVWTKMLNGNWAESSQSEICLPDDSCDAFLIVLRIAHFQLSELPDYWTWLS
jgi:hypothetical protein